MSNTQENNSELIPQTPKGNGIISELDRAMERYTKALSAIETANPKPSQQEILEVLVARDTVSATLSQNQNHSSETLVTLINLDTRLRQQADPIAAIGKLEEWRSSLHPPETAWWWFFQRHHKHLSVWEKYDWLWDTITVGCLLLTSSFMSNLFQRLAVGGLNPLEAFGVFAQGGAGLLIAGGTLTDNGKEYVENFLKKIGIPSHLHSEIICGFSVFLLLGSISIEASLPKLAARYYNAGITQLKEGNLQLAQDHFNQTLALAEDYTKTHIYLGEIYETELDFDNALTQYKLAMADNHVEAFNNIGRVYIQQQNYTEAQEILITGLEKWDKSEEKDKAVKYDLLTNLGWALLKQKVYNNATTFLQNAIALDNQQPSEKKQGLAHCLLAKVFQAQGKNSAAQAERGECIKYENNAHTLYEYSWIVQAKQAYKAFQNQAPKPITKTPKPQQ